MLAVLRMLKTIFRTFTISTIQQASVNERGPRRALSFQLNSERSTICLPSMPVS